MRFALTALLVLTLESDAAARAPTGELLQAARAATALVEAGDARRAGSAFCVHPSGLFVASGQVLSGRQAIQLKLAPHTTSQLSLSAWLLSHDPQTGLTLLQAESARPLTAIDLRPAPELVELTELTAFGFQQLPHQPPVFVNRAALISSLQKSNGQLARIELETDFDTQLAGAPMLTANGEIVAVVADSQDQQTRTAVPIDAVWRLLNQPVVRLSSPQRDLDSPVEFRARLPLAAENPEPLSCDLLLRRSAGETYRYPMTADGTEFVATVVPATAAPPLLQVDLELEDGRLRAKTPNQTLQLGSDRVELANLALVQPGLRWLVVRRDGSQFEASPLPVTFPVYVAGRTLQVASTTIRSMKLDPPPRFSWIDFSVVVSQNGRELGRYDGQLPGPWQHILAATGNQLVEFSPAGERVATIEIPQPDSDRKTDARALAADAEGTICVTNGILEPVLSVFANGHWRTHAAKGWRSDSRADPGIAVNGRHVFVTNRNPRYREDSGILRIDLDSDSVQEVSRNRYANLTLGLDGLLYASGNAVDVYDLNLLKLQRTIRLDGVSSHSGLAVNQVGELFVIQTDGWLTHVSSHGGVIKRLDTGIPQLRDISISPAGQSVLGSDAGLLGITDTSFSKVIKRGTEGQPLYVTFGRLSDPRFD